MADSDDKKTDQEEKKSEDGKQQDWKKQGFDNNERLTLKINVDEAKKYQAEQGKKKVGALPKNLQKLQKKVRDSYDEEDEDGVDEDVLRSLRELQINQNDASNGDNSLINALSQDERRQIMQSTTIEVTRHEENAGRQNALEQADRLSRQAGLKKMTTQEFMNEMQEAIYNPSRLRRQALEDNIAKKMGIQGEITKHNEGNVVKGVRKLNEVTDNRQVKNIKMDDVKNIGGKAMTNNQTAELILRKSGQTAKLSEIKRQAAAPKVNKGKTQNKNTSKSYALQMKDLLKESLKKNKKVR